MAKKNDTKIKITQTKSAIGYNVKQKRTLEALGLHRLNHSVIHVNTPQIEGMVIKVRHLVSVEDIK